MRCVLVALSLLVATPAAAQKITRGPYLQWATQSSIYVVWDQDKASAPTVHYGKTKSYTGRVTSMSGKHHEVKLTGLSAGTTYNYAVYQGGAKLSADLTFPTAVTAGTPFRFVVYGDSRSQAQQHKDIVTALALEPGVRFYVNTGDLVSSGEVAAQWNEFFKLETLGLSHMPLYPVIGNHDEKSGKAPLYKQAFVLPNNSKDPEEYYSFDYGNAHFTMLDSHINVDKWYVCALQLKFYDACFKADQMKWLEADLKAAAANPKIQHRFVFIHMGPFSSKQGRSGNGQMQALLPTFKKYKVTVLFSGHDHYYEHGLAANGVPYVITGGGGAPLYTGGSPSLPLHKVIYYKSTYHYNVVDVNGSQVKVTVKTPKGKQLEYFTLGKAPPPTPDAGVPDSALPPDSKLTADGVAPDVKPAVDTTAPTKDGVATADKQAADTSAVDQAPSSSDATQVPPEQDEVGCSCGVGGSAPAGVWCLLALLALLGRRRYTGC